MKMGLRWPLATFVSCLLLSAAVLSAQDAYTVVAVMPSGAVVLRGPGGVMQYDVPAGTMFSVDGKSTSVADLRPGMTVSGREAGISNWHTTSVTVNEELNAQIVAMAGNSMLIRGQRGVRKYQWSDAGDIHIVKDGKEVDPLTLKVGDVITGMIVTKAAPSKMASSMTQTKMESAPAPKAAPAPPAGTGRREARAGSGTRARSGSSGEAQEAAEDRVRAAARRSPRGAVPRGRRGSDGRAPVSRFELDLTVLSPLLRPRSRGRS